MKIIFDNIIFSLQRAGGISVYWYELQKRFLQASQEIAVFEKSNNNLFSALLGTIKKNEEPLPVRFLRYLPFTGTVPPQSLFHSSYYRVALGKRVCNIVTVHDFTYEKYRTGLAKMVHSRQKKAAVRYADGIICVSENTKSDLLHFYPHISVDRIAVIPNGVGDEFFPVDNLAEQLAASAVKTVGSEKIVLYVGDRKAAYKKFALAVEALAHFPEMVLVSIGAGAITAEEQELVDRVIPGRFRHFSGLSSQDLNLLYNHAFCLLYPSSYEGFGIPILEAVKAGCPVVATNSSSIPEVAGEAGILVNEVSAETLAAAMRTLADETFRNHIIEAGFAQATKFSWDRCFDETIAFYQQCYDWKFT